MSRKLQQKSRNGSPVQPSSAHPLVTILGPTASGKSQLAIELAQMHHGEIICADSRTIYRGMDIGTAKPSGAEQRNVPHHLLDICSPSEPFSAKDFVDYAKAALKVIWDRQKVPFIVGGSGMYIDALLYNYQFRKTPIIPEADDMASLSLDQLWELSYQRHGSYPAQSDRQNRRRLEQFIHRGPVKQMDRDIPLEASCIIGLNPGREKLQRTIAQRTEAMLATGFITEVRQLRQRYGAEAAGLNAPGYREVSRYLDGGLGESELATAINQATWQLARKQLTWFRRNPSIQWFSDTSAAAAWVSTYLAPWRQVQ